MMQVRQKCGMPTVDLTLEELSRTDISMWASNPAHTGLGETLDQKEVIFLGQLLADLGNHKLGRVTDLIAQRVREIKSAKSSGGSWEKAQVVSLMSQPISNVVPMLDNAFIL